jgi:hypothetical protein
VPGCASGARRRPLRRVQGKGGCRLRELNRTPWSLQRPFMGLWRFSSHTASAWHGVPFRVLAPHRGRSDLGTLGSGGENRRAIKSMTRAHNGGKDKRLMCWDC